MSFRKSLSFFIVLQALKIENRRSREVQAEPSQTTNNSLTDKGKRGYRMRFVLGRRKLARRQDNHLKGFTFIRPF